MKCGINTLRDMKKTLLEAALDGPLERGAISSTGESFDLTTAFYRGLAEQIRDPDSVLAELEAREANLDKPFHQSLRRELGEEVYIQTDKGTIKHFLLSSHTVPNTSALGGIEVVMRFAPAGNIASVSEYVFRLDSDTSVKSIGREVGTIPQIGNYVQRALSNSIRKARSERTTKVELDSQGDPALKETLKKMADTDTVLNSRQNRNADSLRGYEKINNYVHGNIDSMKEILGKLHVLGNSKATQEQMAYYGQLLETMNPRFFNNVELFLKTNASNTWGQVNWKTDTVKIDVVSNPNITAWQSEAEVYMHEIVHTMTAWALRQQDKDISPIRLQLNHAMAVAKANSTWKDFLTVPEQQATPNDIKKAKAFQKYIFTEKSSVDEFIAYTLTNPQMMAHMKTIKVSDIKTNPETVFERVMNFFGNVLNVLTGRFNFQDKDVTVFDKVNDLAFRLAEVNNKNVNNLKSMNPVGQMMEAVDKADRYLADKIDDIKTKISNTDKRVHVPKDSDGVYANAKFLVTTGVRAFTNPVYRGFIGLWASAWGMRPNGTLREIASTFFDRSEQFRAAERLNLLSDKIDATRNSVINASSGALRDSFTRPLTVEEDSALTRALLNTNLASLRYKRVGRSKRPDPQTKKLLIDSAYRSEQSNKVKYKIKQLLKDDPERAKWTVAQGVSLGYYMATGKAHVAQNYNSSAIVSGFGLGTNYDANASLSTLVDELAAITAVEYVSDTDRKLVADLLTSEKKGIDAVTDAYAAYASSSKEYLFKTTEAHMMTGHTVELLDDSIDITIAPASQAAAMQQKGYTLRYKLDPKAGDSYKNRMAVYTTGTWGKASRTRGTVGLGKIHAKGTSLQMLKRIDDPGLSEITHKRDLARVKSSALSIHAAMRNGTFDVTKVDYGLGPVFDSTGNISDFRYMMSKENKEALLGQDLRATQVLPRSMGNVTHQIGREKLNAEALKLLKEDMRDNWVKGGIGKDHTTEYSLIGPNATDPAMRELFTMLPETYREYIDMRPDKTLAVRTDLLRIYFGDKDFKLSSASMLKVLPGVLKQGIDIVEGIWQEMIKISKGAILLKMPLILVFNMVSNIRYQINTGSLDLVQLGKDYKNSTREVNEYLNYNRKAISLRLEIARDEEAASRVRNTPALRSIMSEKRVELERLELALKNNPAKELFDAGMYQTHIEDIDNSALNETNRLTKGINNRLESAPALVRGAAEIAYLTQNTAWYKFSQETLQRTDMITRLVDNKREIRKERSAVKGETKLPRWWLTEKRKTDPSYPDTKVLTEQEAIEFYAQARNVRHTHLLDSYINYTLPNGTFEEYLNRMGLLMFTKYLKRIQPVITNTFVNHPLKTGLTLLTAGAFQGADIIQDQALIARGFDPSGDFSLGNLVPVYSAMFHLENVLTPPIVKEELRMNLF